MTPYQSFDYNIKDIKSVNQRVIQQSLLECETTCPRNHSTKLDVPLGQDPLRKNRL
jgi:hypothetical protein